MTDLNAQSITKEKRIKGDRNSNRKHWYQVRQISQSPYQSGLMTNSSQRKSMNGVSRSKILLWFSQPQFDVRMGIGCILFGGKGILRGRQDGIKYIFFVRRAVFANSTQGSHLLRNGCSSGSVTWQRDLPVQVLIDGLDRINSRDSPNPSDDWAFVSCEHQYLYLCGHYEEWERGGGREVSFSLRVGLYLHIPMMS